MDDQITFHPKTLTTLSSQKSLRSLPSLTTTSDSSSSSTHRLLNSFTAHSAAVSSIAVSGAALFTGSSDHHIASWTTATNNNLFSFPAGNGAVKSLVADPGGTRLFTAHQDHKIRVWATDDQDHPRAAAKLATLPTLGDRAASLATPRVHVRRHKTSTWVRHVDAVSALALSPDGELLYSASWDRSLKVWRTKDFRCLESVNDAHDDAVNALVASPDGHVFTGSADKKIKVWMRDEKQQRRHCQVATLERHGSGINALAVGRGGAVLYSGAGDRSLVVWERVVSGDGDNWEMVVLGALRGHERPILCLAAAGDLVFSGSADKTVRVWRGVQRSYSCVAVFTGHAGPVKCLTAVIEPPDCGDDDDDESYLVYSGGLDCEVKVWQIAVPSITI